jgi:D-galactarolactone cycloisomerase
MKIKDIRAIPIGYTLEKGLQQGYSRGWSTNRSSTLVIVEAGDGIIGIGDCYYPALPVAAVIEEMLKPAFVGRDIFDRTEIFDEIHSGRYTVARRGLIVIALSGLDIALWDLIGKELGQPICNLLGGGVRDKVVAYASHGHFTAAAGLPDDTSLERDAKDCLRKHFKGIKIKVGKGIEDDYRRVKRVREIVGDDFPLMIDYNGNYPRYLAIQSIEKVSPYSITWAEEPLPPEDIDGYISLRNNSVIPIALGEAEESTFDMRDLIAKGAADIIMPDISKCGGLTGAWDIVRVARLWNMRVSPHVWSSAVSLAAGIQLSMSIPKYPHTLMEPEIYPWLEYDTSPNGLRTDILREPIEPNSSGYIEAPKGPGLGIELNWEAVEKYTIR